MRWATFPSSLLAAGLSLLPQKLALFLKTSAELVGGSGESTQAVLLADTARVRCVGWPASTPLTTVTQDVHLTLRAGIDAHLSPLSYGRGEEEVAAARGRLRAEALAERQDAD